MADNNTALLTIRGTNKDLGGFSVRRMLPSYKRKTVGGFIFFDHMGPAKFAANEGIDVRPHPHIGLCTITYLFDGALMHRDSLGTTQRITPGDINLMVAGHGITHSERTPDDVRPDSHNAEGLQLWLALPAEKEACEPAFYHYPRHDIPNANINGVTATVMMGSAWNMESPVVQYGNNFYASLHMPQATSIDIPDMHAVEEIAIYVVSGEVMYGDDSIATHDMLIPGNESRSALYASEDAHIILIGGAPIGKRYIDWNFVSSDKATIEAAKNAWQTGQFPIVPGDEKEYIPLPT